MIYVLYLNKYSSPESASTSVIYIHDSFYTSKYFLVQHRFIVTYCYNVTNSNNFKTNQFLKLRNAKRATLLKLVMHGLKRIILDFMRLY